MNRFTLHQPALWVVGLLGMAGCNNLRNEIEPDRLNREAAKLVVTCFLSPQDQVLAAKVTRTTAVLGDQRGTYADNSVVNATVTLADGGRSVVLTYDTKLKYYRADSKQLPIVAGHTYALTVQTPANERLTSSCTVPGVVKLSGTSFDSLTTVQDGRSVKRYFIRARWQDPAGLPGYYHVTGLFRFIKNCPACEKNASYRPKEEVTYLEFDRNEEALVSKPGSAASTLTSEPAFLNGNSDDDTPAAGFRSQYKAAMTVVNLLNTDQNYYHYQEAIIQQAKTKGNPFAEPVLLPNNIEGGLGCFAAYNRSTVMVTLR